MTSVPQVSRSNSAQRPWSAGTCWAVGTVGPGSAGASTLAVILTTYRRGLLVEADADGGVLAARYGAWLHEQAPSLASLLAALPAYTGKRLIEDHMQVLPSGARAVLVVPDTEGAFGPVRRLAQDLGQLRQRLPEESLVLDVGRVRPGNPSLQLAEQSDALIVVVRPEVESLGCLLARVAGLQEHVPQLVVAVRGEGSYSLGDIRASVNLRTEQRVPVVAVPDDPRGVKALGQAGKPRRASPGEDRAVALMHAASVLASALSESVQGEERSSVADRARRARFADG